MELTINVAEITDLVIQDSDGKRYLIIEEGAAYDVLEQVKDATAERTKTLLTQRELMKERRVSRNTIKKWVAMGLSEIPDGNRIYYDTEELDALLKAQKI